MPRDIRQTHYFNQTPEEVWKFLTQPELLAQWLGKTDFKPEVGHKFQFESPNGNHSQCEVLEVKPFTRLVFSWQKRSLTDKKEFRSRVEWTLVPQADGTELRLLHNGFTAIEDVEGHDSGWAECIRQMGELMNKK